MPPNLAIFLTSRTVRTSIFYLPPLDFWLDCTLRLDLIHSICVRGTYRVILNFAR